MLLYMLKREKFQLLMACAHQEKSFEITIAIK